MSNRFYSLMSLGVAALLGTALFLTSEAVQRAEKEFSHLREQGQVARDTARLLRAEWAYLNRPDRLDQLAQTHLHLAPGSSEKMITAVDVLPNPFVPTIPGIKPASILAAVPASNVSSAVLAMNVPASQPQPQAPANPALSIGFDQLISRYVDATEGRDD